MKFDDKNKDCQIYETEATIRFNKDQDQLKFKIKGLKATKKTYLRKSNSCSQPSSNCALVYKES